MSDEVETHPVQTHHISRYEGGRLPKTVTMAAYQVYCEVYSPQEAIVTGSCRGGFSISEIIVFLYARSFPKAEWRDRVEEASRGMKNM